MMLRSRRRASPPPHAAPPSPRVSPPPASPQTPERRLRRALAIVGIGLVVARVLRARVLPAADLAGFLDGKGAGGALAFLSHGSNRPHRRLLPPRFPRYGSPEFAAACPWAVAEPSANNVSVSPTPRRLVPWARHSEGLASWVSSVAQAFIYSRLLAETHHVRTPLVLLEFEGMNVTEVVQPPDGHGGDAGWAVGPRRAGKLWSSYEWCQRDPECVPIGEDEPWDEARKTGLVPLYRRAYKNNMRSNRRQWIYEGDYDNLTRILPGFAVETGMACALNSMWEPSPRLAEHEPGLFAELLPELRRDDTLVISLYLRTSWTDLRMPVHGMAPRSARWDESADRHSWQREADELLRPFVACAQQLEREHFATYSVFPHDNGRDEEVAAFSKIVWMISSDSPLLKQYVNDTYHEGDTLLTSDTNGTLTTHTIPRRVLLTGAEGVHTKSSVRPKHPDVARAFIDWYLLGESDAVIAEDNYYSFGMTAALRTARPVHSVRSQYFAKDTCTRQSLVRTKRKQ